jgi:hypothetical protein
MTISNSAKSGTEFAAHILMATAIFVVVAAAAVGLGYFVHWVAGTPPNIVAPLVPRTLQVIEYGVFAIDIVTYSVYVLVNAYSFIKSLF